jgi:histidinol-phosphate phosphatase family protein
MQRPPNRELCSSLSALKRALNQRRNLMYPAVFVDRDGTINVERGYLRDPEAVTLLPKAAEALTVLNTQRIPVIVITNQSALGRGLMHWSDFESVSDALWNALQARDTFYDALYYCPHTPNDLPPCGCRKPQPGMLLQAAFDLNLALHRSFLVGDKLSDLEAARQCGCHAILVRTGWGQESYEKLLTQDYKPDYVADTLLDAADWIVSRIEE